MIESDIETEARALVAAAEAEGLPLRLLGGLAVRLHAPSTGLPAFSRAYPDLDIAAPPRQSHRIEAFFASRGYAADRNFNLLNGDRRLLFYDEANRRQVDVFVGQFAMCHRLAFNERITGDAPTLPLAELLLTKLQIVQLNDKDARDSCALLLDHPLGEGDAETINLPRLLHVCGDDWGWWRTVTQNLAKLRELHVGYGLPLEARTRLSGRLEELTQALHGSPKTLRWKTRAILGDKVRWYEEPEEVN
ncbi:MAG: hypothetical protein MUD01_11625 [Chloroflexaceae bacterium]|jgi:hypothetical protein|nr:hypothetical protein [Chloroflexaceae bacterium]